MVSASCGGGCADGDGSPSPSGRARNPIEQVFAKLKGFVRKAAPRTLDAVSDAIAQALTTIPPNECANYLAGAGYASA